MPGDEAITFPDAPRGELDRVLGDLVENARKVLETQGRLRALVRANSAVVSHLELGTVLRTIVEAAVELVGARYGALGVTAEAGGLEQFVQVGRDESRPTRFETITGDARSTGFPHGLPATGAVLGVPITVRDEVYGNLYLTDPTAGSFSDDDEQLVRALAANAGFAIDNARLYAETSARQAWSAAAAEVTSAVLGGEIAEGFEELSAHVKRLTRAESVTVLEWDASRGLASVIVADGAPIDAPIGFPLTDHRLQSVLEVSRPAHLDALGSLPPTPESSSGPALVIPLEHISAHTTALIVTRETGAPPFTGFELERAAAFVGQAVIAMELAASRADHQRLLLLDDRTRIARDLHDHVIQQLYSAGIELQTVQAALGDETLAGQIDATVRILDDSIAQIRTIIFALSHERGAGGSLRHRLLDIVHDVGGSLGRPATLSFSGPVDLVSGPALADDVAAFVREALTNIVRHAGAVTASVSVTASPEQLAVTVTDDGHGIGDTARRSGLKNLEDRARDRDGTLTVESSTSGTRLEFRLPVPSETP